MALRLADNTQCINYGNILQPTANMTVMCWFNAEDLSSWKMIFGREDNSGSQPGWHLEINNNQKGDFHSDHGPNMVNTITTIQLNTWYHMVGVRDQNAGVQRIYLNGILEGTTAIGTIENVINEFQIGETLGWPGEGFIGIMDDVRVYDRALDDDEIQTIYSCKGCDSILNGLQARWLFIGEDEKQMEDSISDITVNNVQETMSVTSARNISLSYTIPNGNDLILIVAATAEGSNSGRVIATSVTFGADSLTNIISTRTTNSPYNGVSLWRMPVTAGQSGTITVNWRGNNSYRTLCVYTLANVDNIIENTASAYNNSAEVTTGITTSTDKAIIVSACANKSEYLMTPIGTDHIVDTTIVASGHAGAIGHLITQTAGTFSGIGFTSSPLPSGEALVLAAFRPIITGEQVIELSNNEFVGTAVNSPVYKETFLKIRRTLYSRS